MPTASTDQDSEPRARLADIIERRRDDIERRWLERISSTVKGRPVPRSELRDSMPEYLSRLGKRLRAPGTIATGGSSCWENVAKEHAETRVHLGFDIDQLIEEFIILRRVLFEVIEEEAGSFLDLTMMTKLTDLIDGAIQAAVKSYVESRDYELRRQQAEHLGFLTHELRNPLNTALLGTCRLRSMPSLSPEQSRVLDALERNQRRLADLIDGVLVLEREQHALSPEPAVSTIGQVLEEPIASAKAAADAKRLHLEARFDPDVAVFVDHTLTTSALDNVLQNAVKYTDTGLVELDVEDGAASVVVHVRDTGPGISSEDLRTIFEPFRRGQSPKPGTGLGLAIARRALEVQGGTIHVESGPKKGSHFWMTLPKPRH